MRRLTQANSLTRANCSLSNMGAVPESLRPQAPGLGDNIAARLEAQRQAAAVQARKQPLWGYDIDLDRQRQSSAMRAVTAGDVAEVLAKQIQDAEMNGESFDSVVITIVRVKE